MSLARLEKGGGTNQPCQQQQAQGCSSPPLRCGEWQVTVKQESPEEESPGSPSCSGSVKVEDFTAEGMLATQTKMLEEWRPDVLDDQNHHSNIGLSCTGLAQAHHQNLPPAPDLPSLSSDFPNIFQLAEAAPLPDTPAQVHVGVHFRSSRSPGLPALFACKSCDQTFPLPSLLRRHQAQCQQRSQPQAVGNKGRKRQFYMPGHRPFHCTVCNREFNRMENLKTHLRIHTGERPYTCSVCSTCFRHSGALTRHFRIHTGEKPYVCGQCGKSFRNCGGLRFHQRSHSKQQP